MEDTFSSGDIAAAATALASPAASDASPASAPASTDQAADPIAPPADTGSLADPPATGEPPKERWADILANARKKERDAAQAEFEQQYGWAKSPNAAVTRQWMELAERDPILAMDRFYQGLINHPQHAQAARSYFARQLAGGRQQNTDPMPGPDIPTSDSNGQPVVYSAKQMQALMDWKDRQFQRQLDQRFAPIQQERELHAAQTQAQEYSEATIGELSKRPGFAEHKDEIAKAYAAIPLEDPRTEGEKLRDAYIEVVGRNLDKLTNSARQQGVADLQRKATATTINPAAATASEPYDFKKNTKFTSEDFARVWAQKVGR